MVIRKVLHILYMLFVMPVAFAIAAPLEVLRYPPAQPSAARLKAELSYMAQADDERTVMRSDLRREGHGFRFASMGSVKGDYEGFATA